LSFDRIPHELRALDQWVVWRYIQRDDGKWTKLLYDPKSMMVASATDRDTWSTFEHACHVAKTVAGVAGIGFVLTHEDDFCFIDLDDPYALHTDGRPKHLNPEDVMALQRQIVDAMDTYAELSPSGRGLHLISRGSIPQGKRKGAIEIYSAERYMTMTGNVYKDRPISPQQPMIDWVYEKLGGGGPVVQMDLGLFEADKQTDDVVMANAFGAANGVKFQALWEGRFQDAGLVDNSWSAADFALIDMLQWHTTSRQQIRRLFFQSALAQREKARRPGYVESMIQRSFDRVPASVDLEALTAALEQRKEREAAAQAAAANTVRPILVSPAYNPDDVSPYLKPIPGLMGAIAWFIYRAAPRPVPEIAVAGAIGLMAGICGRAFNVSSTGLNVYVLLLAKTGRGKEAIATGIGRLMAPVKAIDGGGGGVPGADEFIGPQEIASGQALIKYLSKSSRSFVSVMSEFDGFLNTLTARNVSPAVAKLKQVLLYAYSKSGHNMRLDKGIYSEAEKNVPVIPAPAVSLVGEGTPDRFYELLSDQLISDGFLPRFSVIEYEGPRTEHNVTSASAVPEPELITALARLCAHCLTLNGKDSVIDVQFTPEAKGLFDLYNLECDKLINQIGTGPAVELWNRAHLKAMKLAALIAVGVNWYAPCIDASAAQWAIDCSRHDTSKLASKFENGNVGIKSVDARQALDVKRKLRKLFEGRSVDGAKYKLSAEALAAGVFNNMYLQNACSNLNSFKEDRRGPGMAYHALMKSLTMMGVIDEMNRADKDRLGVIGMAYVVKDWDWVKSGD
jgi:hypothetical protein